MNPSAPASAPAATPAPSRTNSRLRLVVGIFAAFAILVGFTSWLLYAVYMQRSENSVVRVFAPILPAAKVGSHTIPYSEFLDTRDTLRVYLVSQPAKDSGLAQSLTAELEKNAFDRLIREQIVNDIAAERNVSISDEEVRAQFAELVLQTSSTIPNVAQYLDETFKWTEEEFRARVIRPSLMESRLAASLAGATGTEATPEQLDQGFALLEQEVTKRETSPDVKTYLRF